MDELVDRSDIRREDYPLKSAVIYISFVDGVIDALLSVRAADGVQTP
jgi:hypothetical protein